MNYIPYSPLGNKKLFPNVKHLRNVPELMPKKEQPRNERCRCNSGLKYKKCCGKVNQDES